MSDGHSHSHAPDRSASKRSLRIALALTASFMAAEVIGGLISGSLALLADAAHMLSLSLVLAVAGIVVCRVYLSFEEKHLARTFGEEYTDYKRRTPRFAGIPARQG